jgi:REP element-mobilizing transposase RayT
VGRDLRAIDSELAYHVTCRGSNRQRIVVDTDDCETFCRQLDYAASKFAWEVFAWCLMPNHHHVVLRAEQTAFSAGFQQLNGNYSRITNLRHGRCDHLFRNRPRALELAGEAHLIAAIAYTVRNPVEAGLVGHAAAWPWSSYRATVGLAKAPRWLAVDFVLDLFGRTRERAVTAFEELVHRGHLPVSDTIEQPPAL